MLASSNEWGNASFASIFWKSYLINGIISSLNIWWNSPFKPSGLFLYLNISVYSYKFSFEYASLHAINFGTLCYIIIHPKIFPNLPCDSFSDPFLFQSVLFHFHIFVNFFQFSFSYLYQVIFHCKHSLNEVNHLNALKVVLWPKILTVENVPSAHLKRMFFLLSFHFSLKDFLQHFLYSMSTVINSVFIWKCFSFSFLMTRFTGYKILG